MSIDNLGAARTLLQVGRYRSSVCRAYYAAYCAATYEITKKTRTFANEWNNPPHAHVPRLLKNHLNLTQTKIKLIIKKFRALHHAREDAEYRPGQAIHAINARDCIRDSSTILFELWGTDK